MTDFFDDTALDAPRECHRSILNLPVGELDRLRLACS